MIYRPNGNLFGSTQSYYHYESNRKWVIGIVRGESSPRKGQGSKTLCKGHMLVNNFNKYSGLAQVRLWESIEKVLF